MPISSLEGCFALQNKELEMEPKIMKSLLFITLFTLSFTAMAQTKKPKVDNDLEFTLEAPNKDDQKKFRSIASDKDLKNKKADHNKDSKEQEDSPRIQFWKY